MQTKFCVLAFSCLTFLAIAIGEATAQTLRLSNSFTHDNGLYSPQTKKTTFLTVQGDDYTDHHQAFHRGSGRRDSASDTDSSPSRA